MSYPSDKSMDLPSPEIQFADEPVKRLERSDSIPLHAFPLPLPSDHRDKGHGEGGDEEMEPTLYKKVIYIPDTTETSHRGKKTRNDPNEGSPSSKKFRCEILEEQKREQADYRRCHRDKLSYQWFSKQGAEECLASYKKEWTHCFEFGVIVASHYLLWENIVWGVLMGTWLEQQTRGKLGCVEVFSSYMLCGCAFVLFGGQALLVVGVSAPSVIFIISTSNAANRLLIDFLPWMGWVGIWSSVVLMILAVSGACRFTKSCITFFTWEAIQIFIGMSFIWTAVEEIGHFFYGKINLDTSMMSLWLATSSFAVSIFLTKVGSLKLFNKKLCQAVGKCALPVTLLLFTGVTYLPKLDHPPLQRVTFPVTGFRTDGVTELGSLVGLKNVPLWAVCLAIIPGLLFASMIFVDHSAASILLQNEASLNACRSRSRSWDIYILAILVLVCAIFGLPFCYGLFFKSLKHAQALTHTKRTDLESQESRNEIQVQRISGLIASLLSGLPLVPGLSWVTAKIPLAVVIGLFLEVPLQSLSNLQFMQNTELLLTDASLRPVNGSSESTSLFVLKLYTSIQFACALIIFATSKTPAAILFPLFVLLMIWLRRWPLNTLFMKKGLDKLDGKLFHDQPVANQFTNRRHRKRTCIEGNLHNKNKRKTVMHDLQTSNQSSLPWKSPPVLPTTTKRRLKERKIRRNKRMRRTTISSPHNNSHEDNMHKVVLPLPCRYQLKNTETTNYGGNEVAGSTSFAFSTAKSKLLVRQLSPQLILNKKKKLQSPVEIHTNILYDPHPLSNVDNDNDNLVDGLSISRQLSSSFASPSPSQKENTTTNATDDDLAYSEVLKYAKEEADVVHGASTFPKPTNEDVVPSNTKWRSSAFVEERIVCKKKFCSTSVESSKRTKMILNQGRWPSNKPMSSIR